MARRPKPWYRKSRKVWYSDGDDINEEPDLARIAAALELVGKLSRDPLAANQDGSDEPLLLGRFHVLAERGQEASGSFCGHSTQCCSAK